jgi:hypothetical protein
MGNIVKNNLFNILLTTCFLALLSFSLMTTTGCASKGKTPLGIVKEVIIGDDYYAAGENVGAISVTAYGILKGDSKYTKYTEKMEKVYEELKKADGDITAGSANEIALEIAQAALTAKYGYAKASLITTGIRIGGAVADKADSWSNIQDIASDNEELVAALPQIRNIFGSALVDQVLSESIAD